MQLSEDKEAEEDLDDLAYDEARKRRRGSSKRAMAHAEGSKRVEAYEQPLPVNRPRCRGRERRHRVACD